MSHDDGTPDLERRPPAGQALLSIVIPAKDEAARITSTLARIAAYLRDTHMRAEVIVVDDGSRDGTADVASAFFADARLPARVIRGGTPPGKGAAVAAGVLASSGARILVTDADLSTPIEEVEHLGAALDAGASVAIGSRDVPGSRVDVRQAAYREGMGRTFNLIIRLLGLTRFRDTQCGFKLFDGDVARAVFARLTITHFAYDVEALRLAERMGARIVEVPVVWRNHPFSHVRPGADALRMLGDVVGLWWKG